MTNAHSPQFKQKVAVAAQVQENHISLNPNFAGSYGTVNVSGFSGVLLAVMEILKHRLNERIPECDKAQ